jgi:hypothetical protein
MLQPRRLLLFAIASLLVTGCLPHGCQRDRDRALLPADSLSRQVAQTVPRDTLHTLWRAEGTGAHPMERPRTVRLGPDGRVWLTDAQRNRLLVFGAGGTLRRDVDPTGFDVPYLAGLRRDTAIVFNAGADRFDWIAAGDSVRSVVFQRPDPETLAYTLATRDALYAKVVGEDTDGVLLRLDDRTGAVDARVSLPEPHWTYAGFLRAWGDSLLSLSGFRPEAELLPMNFADDTPLDTLRLVGFDSPMLPRRYAFAQGDVTEAPLLSVSAAPAGPYLFVLNLRPGWVRVDVYDREGRLQRTLRPAERSTRPNFYPVDIDAQRTEEGYRFAIVRQSPSPRLTVYRWRPDAPVPSRSATAARR